ncbi:Survival protein SurE-like phosphatase/nucleotidase [Lasiodiplodia theobromae]|uniref:Survival protein SurE-like phosphatase/nucleotidase n=1 Tax=Lasiodiplodia theobromae TaxID=45133 RepID=UPI0015C40CB7|nr:Survival protein SurE-like phosphatase/nucleotidase [Lasiodiplodia theobromae]KAF4535000.1 Survival protein SurE-like phosphatase/nucleotidase [Lasiodiplodia theobromae]
MKAKKDSSQTKARRELRYRSKSTDAENQPAEHDGAGLAVDIRNIPAHQRRYRSRYEYTGDKDAMDCGAEGTEGFDEAGHVTNDDGPPPSPSSPYVHHLVTALESHGHQVSVILPSTQRSWIGKTHIITDIHHTTAFDPRRNPDLPHHPATTSSSPEYPDPRTTTWTLINGTPASCIQLGLNSHQHSGTDTTTPIDLVLSGPNFGKNTTAVFALSSGTIGAAMEAALCGRRSIAVSFAHAEDGTYDVAEACEHAVKLAEHLYRTWDEDVHVYSAGEKGFEWAPPRFGDVAEGIGASVAPEDSWAIRNGFTSVTPLRANFMHVTRVGELDF